MEEKIAQNVAAIAYVGLWSCIWTINLGWFTNHSMSFLSGGADTVSKCNKISWMILSTVSLDNVSGAVPIPGHGTISGGPEKSTSRNQYCGGPTSPPRFWRSSFSAIHQCYCQRINAMAISIAPLCVFFIIIISTIMTDYEAIPHIATNDDEYNGYYIPKGTILFGGTWPVWTITGTYLCVDRDCLPLGPYCMTPKFLKIPWSTSLNGIWRMESSIQIWWIGTLWHLVTDVGKYIQHTILRLSLSIFPLAGFVLEDT